MDMHFRRQLRKKTQMCVSAETFIQKRNVHFEGLNDANVFLSNVSAEMLVCSVFTKLSSKLNVTEVGLFRFIVLNNGSADLM